MGVITRRYIKKPLYVDAVRITRKNFQDVARWCGGHIQTERENAPENAGKKYLKIQAHNPINTRQTKAFVGDWILRTKRGFKVYTHNSFIESFDRVAKPENQSAPSSNEQAPAFTEEEEFDSCAIPKLQFDPSVAQ